mmetsp:Transcript_56139/g.134589  ORF Transcript_56139/g.134589 Transcript_56139/m.134589 type:complete len:87 (-) Transcript_56139:1091-1351(-)
MASMSTYYPMIYDFLVEQGLSKAAAALKTESKIDAKTPRSDGSLVEVLRSIATAAAATTALAATTVAATAHAATAHAAAAPSALLW